MEWMRHANRTQKILRNAWKNVKRMKEVYKENAWKPFEIFMKKQKRNPTDMNNDLKECLENILGRMFERILREHLKVFWDIHEEWRWHARETKRESLRHELWTTIKRNEKRNSQRIQSHLTQNIVSNYLTFSITPLNFSVNTPKINIASIN